MKRHSFLTCICLLQLLLLTASQEIPVKSFLVPLSQMQQSYDVVHSDIFPSGSQVTSSIPHDFYVAKLLKDRPKVIQPEKHDRIQQVNDAVQSSPQVQQNIQANPFPKGTEQIQTNKLNNNALDTNEAQEVEWMIQQPHPLASIVVEKGLQFKIIEAPAKEGPIVRFEEEGKLPNFPYNSAQNIPPQSTPSNINTANKESYTVKPDIIPSKVQQSPHLAVNPMKKSQENQFSSQLEKFRFDEHRKNLIALSGLVIILLLIVIFVRSRRGKKVYSLAQLHSRLQNFKEDDEQHQIFRQKEEEEKVRLNGSKPRLSVDDSSDGDGDIQDGSNSLVE